MQLGTKSRYALRILIQLAEVCSGDKTIKAKELSKSQNITEAYIEQIMLPLKKHCLVRTVRGCNGGYTLAKKPSQITVLEIIEIFEGKFSLVHCMDEENTCAMFDKCLTKNIWGELADFFREKAKKYTVEDIISGNKS